MMKKIDEQIGRKKVMSSIEMEKRKTGESEIFGMVE